MSTELDAIGERLREALNRWQVSPSQLADRFGVSRATVSQWLHGRNITLQTLRRFSEEFDVSVNWLIYGTGDTNRVSSLDINDKEEALLTIMRYIKHDITPTLMQLLKSINSYNRSAMSIEHHAATDKIFLLTRVARAKVALDGTLLEANEFLGELIGCDACGGEEPLNGFTLVAAEYHNRLKASIEKIKSEGVGTYNYYELIHQQTGERLRVISKASLCQHEGQLAIEVLLKPVVADADR